MKSVLCHILLSRNYSISCIDTQFFHSQPLGYLSFQKPFVWCEMHSKSKIWRGVRHWWGRLKKEYGSLLQLMIFSSEANLFEGFQVVGKIVAYLIVHLDIGIPCLSRAIYQFILSGSLETAAQHCTLEYINEYCIRELIIKVIIFLAANFLHVRWVCGFLKDQTTCQYDTTYSIGQSQTNPSYFFLAL